MSERRGVQMDARAITRRLRLMAEQSGPDVPRVDRSRDAITARLRDMSELSALCARLEALGRSRDGGGGRGR